MTDEEKEFQRINEECKEIMKVMKEEETKIIVKVLKDIFDKDKKMTK